MDSKDWANKFNKELFLSYTFLLLDVYPQKLHHPQMEIAEHTSITVRCFPTLDLLRLYVFDEDGTNLPLVDVDFFQSLSYNINKYRLSTEIGKNSVESIISNSISFDEFLSRCHNLRKTTTSVGVRGTSTTDNFSGVKQLSNFNIKTTGLSIVNNTENYITNITVIFENTDDENCALFIKVIDSSLTINNEIKYKSIIPTPVVLEDFLYNDALKCYGIKLSGTFRKYIICINLDGEVWVNGHSTKRTKLKTLAWLLMQKG